jgi:hypothetical protein
MSITLNVFGYNGKMKIILKDANGKLKKRYKYSFVGFAVFAITALGIGGICISALKPYSEITATSLTPSDGVYTVTITKTQDTIP